MAIRETLNENKNLVIAAVVAVSVLSLGYSIYSNFLSNPAGDIPPLPTKFAYTIDDGKTFFTDDPKIPPFDKDGKQAAQAVLYTCDGGKTKFVGLVVRFSPKIKQAVEEEKRVVDVLMGPLAESDIEIKAPGGKDWVSKMKNSREYGKLVTGVKCPDGKGEPIETTP